MSKDIETYTENDYLKLRINYLEELLSLYEDETGVSQDSIKEKHKQQNNLLMYLLVMSIFN